METLDLYLARSVASLGELCTENEQNRVCKSEVFLQPSISSFFCRTRFDDSKPFWEKIQRLYMKSKVRGFDGTAPFTIKQSFRLHHN
jgi:hypothetical protein